MRLLVDADRSMRYTTVIIILQKANLWNPSCSRSNDQFNLKKLHRTTSFPWKLWSFQHPFFGWLDDENEEKEMKIKEENKSKHWVDSILEGQLSRRNFCNISRKNHETKITAPFSFHGFPVYPSIRRDRSSSPWIYGVASNRKPTTSGSLS